MAFLSKEKAMEIEVREGIKEIRKQNGKWKIIKDNKHILIFIFWRKYTFSPYILTFFHFGPYILILPLLVLKSIKLVILVPFVNQQTEIA